LEEGGKYSSHHTNEQELSTEGGGSGEEQRTPFILKRNRQEKTGEQWKNHNLISIHISI